MNQELWIPALGLAATMLLIVVGLLNFSVFLRQLKLARDQHHVPSSAQPDLTPGSL